MHSKFLDGFLQETYLLLFVAAALITFIDVLLSPIEKNDVIAV
jgi:hypothetical protein